MSNPQENTIKLKTNLALSKFKVDEFKLFKCLIFICICFFFLSKSFGQTPDTYDQLNSNTSAAFVLLGISPTEIARPTSIGDFAGSLQTATDNFNSLPNTYAMEMSLDPGRTGTEINKRTLSFAYINELDPFVQSRISLGFKYSLADNENSDESNEAIDLIRTLDENDMDVYQVMNSRFKSSYSLLDKSDLSNASKGVAKIDKGGAFLDIHLGGSFKIRDNNFKATYLDRLGIWMNFGQEEIFKKKNKISLYGTLKGIYEKFSLEEQPLVNTSGVTNIDTGTRMVVLAFDEKLECSAEALLRIRHTMKRTYKIGTQLSLDMGNNKKLSFSFGRDFDSLIEREGNLFSLLNFISSFNNN